MWSEPKNCFWLIWRWSWSLPETLRQTGVGAGSKPRRFLKDGARRVLLARKGSVGSGEQRLGGGDSYRAGKLNLACKKLFGDYLRWLMSLF